ncbi:MAG: hypothetical protein GYA62_05160, partial [Bacteroidales bacterium]|nr:hypothetical protein [Bacteroidales bacterium]
MSNRVSIIILILIAYLSVSYAQDYPNVSIRDIQYVPQYLLASGQDGSEYIGDTVQVTGIVMVRSVVDPTFDRRPIMWAGARWQTYLQDTSDLDTFVGLNLMQNDTTGVAHNSLMDLIDTAQIVTIVGVVEELGTRNTLLYVRAIYPVQFSGQLPKRPEPKEITIAEMNSGAAPNPVNIMTSGEKYEGQYVILRNVISSNRNTSTGTFYINDGLGNSMLVQDQSGYFTKRSHKLRAYEPPPDGTIISYVQGVVGHNYNPNHYTIRPIYPSDMPAIFPPAISILSPVGGEKWWVNSQHKIKWMFSYLENVKIEYSTNNGSIWIPIILSTPANQNEYTWTVPNTLSSQCKIKISNVADSSIYSISPLPFSIIEVPTLNLTSPIGGEVFEAGTQRNITWTSSNVGVIKIEYSTDNGMTWNNVIPSIYAEIGSYSWLIPNVSSSLCKVKISDVENNFLVSMSNSVFTILPLPAINLTSPNGGENGQVFSQLNISWTSVSVENIKIDYTTNNGTSWTNIVSSIPASTGSYSWTVPYPLSSQCKIRLSDVNDSTIISQSNSTFSITSPLNITSPTGSQNW